MGFFQDDLFSSIRFFKIITVFGRNSTGFMKCMYSIINYNILWFTVTTAVVTHPVKKKPLYILYLILFGTYRQYSVSYNNRFCTVQYVYTISYNLPQRTVTRHTSIYKMVY